MLVFLGFFFYLQKNAKTSPRWQYNSSVDIKRNKDNKTATELIEDERDPDVIPAQYGKFDKKKTKTKSVYFSFCCMKQIQHWHSLLERK